MARYMLLIYGDQKRWGDVDEATMATVIEEYFAFDDALDAVGALVDSAPLEPASRTRTVAPGGVVTDGPFAETAELLGGYYLVDVADEATAIEWAAKLPGVVRGMDHVEVRAIVELARP
jgi:hypothetical protein